MLKEDSNNYNLSHMYQFIHVKCLVSSIPCFCASSRFCALGHAADFLWFHLHLPPLCATKLFAAIVSAPNTITKNPVDGIGCNLVCNLVCNCDSRMSFFVKS